MDLFVLFGLRKDESVPEALTCMTEYDNDSNPEYLDVELQKHKADTSFENVVVVRLSVDEKQIMNVLRPTIKAIPAYVVK